MTDDRSRRKGGVIFIVSVRSINFGVPRSSQFDRYPRVCSFRAKIERLYFTRVLLCNRQRRAR